MTLNEFKAWLDGFSEAIGESPTPEQWAKVREKLALVMESPFIAPTYPQPFTMPTYPTQPTYPPMFSPHTIEQPFARPFTTC